VTVTPLDVWNAYPGSDLLPIDPPEEYENFKEYTKRVEDDFDACGDTLFAFIMRECSSSDGHPLEVSSLMHRALCDLAAVRSMADEKLFKLTTTPAETPIAHLPLSVRSRKAVAKLGIKTIEQLARQRPEDLLLCRNFGESGLNEIREKLSDRGLTLREEE
jgi:hypothetical protein